MRFRSRHHIRAASAALLGLALSPGCGQPPGFRRIKTGYTSGHPEFHQHDAAFSFVRGVFPFKTWLVTADPEGQWTRKVRIPGYGFSGQQAVIPSSHRAVVAATHIQKFDSVPCLLLIDLDKGEVVREQELPEAVSVLSIEQPAWSHDVYILLSHDGAMVLQRMDSASGELSEPDVLGRYQGVEGPLWWRERVMRALDAEPTFSDRAPIVLVQAEAKDGKSMVAYDLQAHQPVALFPCDTESLQVQEGESPDTFYGLSQKPGQNKGMVRRFNTVTKQVDTMFEFDGVPESFWEVNNHFYVIARDHARPQDRKKYFLHPRTLYIFESGQANPVAMGPWTQRNGRFIGYGASRQELYFAVIDQDDPAIWCIREDRDVLGQAVRVIS